MKNRTTKYSISNENDMERSRKKSLLQKVECKIKKYYRNLSIARDSLSVKEKAAIRKEISGAQYEKSKEQKGKRKGECKSLVPFSLSTFPLYIKRPQASGPNPPPGRHPPHSRRRRFYRPIPDSPVHRLPSPSHCPESPAPSIDRSPS
jgi:hypothetical protein